MKPPKHLKQRDLEKQTREALRKLADPRIVFGDKIYLLTDAEPSEKHLPTRD